MASDPGSTHAAPGLPQANRRDHRLESHPSCACRSIQRISVIVDGGDPCASATRSIGPPANCGTLCIAKGVICEIVPSLDQAAGSAFSVLVAGPDLSSSAKLPANRRIAHQPSRASVSLPAGCWKLRRSGSRPAAERGFVYGLLELAERVQFMPIWRRACIWPGRSRSILRTKSEASHVCSAARSRTSRGTTIRIFGEAIWMCSRPAGSIALTLPSAWLRFPSRSYRRLLPLPLPVSGRRTWIRCAGGPADQ